MTILKFVKGNLSIFLAPTYGFFPREEASFFGVDRVHCVNFAVQVA